MDYQHLQTLKKASLAIVLGLLTCNWPLQAAFAIELNLPDNPSFPDLRETRRSRCSCLFSYPLHIQALVPKSSGGTTVSLSPTFYIYVPPNQTDGARFGIEDENGKEIYETVLNHPIPAGVISFTIPTTPDAPVLEVGKNYYWYFQVRCQKNDYNDFVQGWIRRVELSDTQKQELAAASPSDRINLYAKAGLWYELLDTVVQLRRQQPVDSPLTATLTTQWANILSHEKVELQNWAKEPLASCCD